MDSPLGSHTPFSSLPPCTVHREGWRAALVLSAPPLLLPKRSTHPRLPGQAHHQPRCGCQCELGHVATAANGREQKALWQEECLERKAAWRASVRAGQAARLKVGPCVLPHLSGKSAPPSQPHSCRQPFTAMYCPSAPSRGYNSTGGGPQLHDNKIQAPTPPPLPPSHLRCRCHRRLPP